MSEAESENPEDFAVIETASSDAAKPRRRGRKPGRKASVRHDAAPAGAGAAERGRRGREPKARADSNLRAAIDGYGNPFGMKCAPGWIAYWVSASDAAKHSHRRWEVARWGDARVAEYKHASPGAKGEVIKHKSLTCFLMRESDHLTLHAEDPARQLHEALKDDAFTKAEESEAQGRRGYARFNEQTVTI